MKNDSLLVSRELLERLNNLTRWHFGNETECVELRALLAAPVVERHQHEWDINEHGTATVCSICGIRSSAAPPELAELQAENVKLRERISKRLIDLTNMRNGRDELQAEIDRLKGGQGEAVELEGDGFYFASGQPAPVAIVVEETQTTLGFLKFDFSGSRYHPPATTVVRKAILLDLNVTKDTKLYASQPAPVSVVLPERKCISSTYTVYNPAIEWNACLDKVKELNQ